MKPLGDYTEADLLEASDMELGFFLKENLFKDHLRGPIEYGYNLSKTGNGMLEVIEAMGKRGFEFDISFPRRGKKYLVCFDEKNAINCQHTYHPSLPRAVAVAALLAIKEKGN